MIYACIFVPCWFCYCDLVVLCEINIVIIPALLFLFSIMLTIRGLLPSIWISGLVYFLILKRMSLEFHWICRSLSVTQPFSQYHLFQPLSIWIFFHLVISSINSSVVSHFHCGAHWSPWLDFFPMFLFCFVVLGWFQDIVNRMFCGGYFCFFLILWASLVLVYRKLLIFMCWFCLLPLWWHKTVSFWWVFWCFQWNNVSPRIRINVFSKNINNLG